MTTRQLRVCVYCASSSAAPPIYAQSASRLGKLLAEAGHVIIYGGGGIGSMCALADGALEAGGEVIGVLPGFMKKLEWAHPKLTRLDVVEDMRERKHQMLTGSDAAVALPGGTGTFEELLEALTLKRLGIYSNPIIIVNTNRYFDPLIAMLDRAVNERFMDERHRAMWTVVDSVDDVLEAVRTAPPWSDEPHSFAVPRAPQS